MEITLGNTTAELLPGRALFLPTSGTLVVADIHLGKSATFRTRGLPVPEGTTASDLGRLTELIEQSKARRLVIAGDLVHSADGLRESVMTLFRTWITQMAIPITLTEGNHDSRAWIKGHNLNLKIVSEETIEGILITHDPADLQDGQPGIAGHLHPGAKITDQSNRPIRVAGFFLHRSEHLILPAYSEFTGIHPISPKESDRFFTELGECVTEIPISLIK